MESESHEMNLVGTHPGGVEEWYCPTCGRLFLMTWPPHYTKLIMEPGDVEAIHRGSKGGLGSFFGLRAPSFTEPADKAAEGGSEALEPWTRYIKSLDEAQQ